MNRQITRENQKYRKGIATMTMVMLILGLLMSISTAFMTMVQTESQIQTMSDDSERAVDAAFTGISYAIAEIQENKNTFTDSGSKTLLLAKEWIILGEKMEMYYDHNLADIATPPYRFRISLADNSNYIYTPASPTVTIKAQGEYIKYSEEETPSATYSAQIIATCAMDLARRVIRVKSYNRVEFEDESSFFKKP